MSDQRREELARALAALRRRLDEAARAAGRDPRDVGLLPVTKYFPGTDIEILAGLGCREFGEARDQEASAKIAALAGRLPDGVRWHMIGRLQRNKARSVALWADVVHSVDSVRLANALGAAAAAALGDGRRRAPLQAYVQVSLDSDTARGGVPIDEPDAVDEVCDAVAGAAGLRLAGLMAVPPVGADPDRAFGRLADERRRVCARHPSAVGLSAGMSGDLESAVKHGSTCVRVGTALMGNRPLTSPAVVTPVTSSSRTSERNPGSPAPPLFPEGSTQ
ncbi:YggS family pyridoxal phosphate-dependent enzyme [Mycolicibacterium brumae]|uniref:Pyridoxal phosphate homeostasis protein n=1 Tax=Mycolicibacterium brumae TaxID=85968 RepID=A0A2G5P6V2_9MYCO|nr:YggS family pyridoxal phosphate-dependent enzyme [Mycolicibacterium brumae]MCV7194657.1 YggS family pyridoxal phosphate-dependent enzyme [Mycolicibacterium brumae]PIB74099.1 YggS family pyridoxal phosphate-dependent enzyme [Mycolicibacterium brumae]RWA19137.1 hypothetical protein MBRU_17275 [Mycolicibacterium brumae DSM 44177]UWW08405.1 YggS family pyridoxal phosphate-dependent enzyme [Mycolicibacterium brumae]